ncbi:glutamate--tRNA ligase [Buchnera aphidicola]|uniref:glutamate--tRNA ligase n=1 Tax=Buchnera aphidicola TaxID=9 RepID=UPI003464B582
MQVRTRFAPSPTGNLHVGSIRTALYSWLFARHHNGKFILRIEDTDFNRSQISSVQSILDGLKWLGLDWDEGPYFQSKRLYRYNKIVDTLLQRGNAYKCFCSIEKIEKERQQQILKGEKPRYKRTCRNLNIHNILQKNYVVRFKNPIIGEVTFYDKIRGKITFENRELDDLVIQRSNGMPTYNLCVVVDDLDMKITHVIRGEDHINNTPRQINILKSLEAPIPIYGHVSMIFDENGHKISKRQNAMNIIEYRNNGILPEALLNYIVRLGWSHGNQEIFSMQEMKEFFSLESVNKSSSVISKKKMLWVNKHYINTSATPHIVDILKKHMEKENINIKNGPRLESLIDLLKNRFYTLKEIAQYCRYFYEDFSFSDKKFIQTYLVFDNCIILEKLYQKISQIIVWQCEHISKVISIVAIECNIAVREIITLLRISITGDIVSPSISSVIFLIGKEKVLFRIKKFINYIQEINCADQRS